MVFGNAKRMDIIHEFVKETKKKKTRTTRRKKSQYPAVPLQIFERSEEQSSATDTTKSSKSTSCSSKRNEWDKNAVNCQSIDRIQSNWRMIWRRGDITDFGEKLIHKMIETDPSSQWLMRLDSTSCERVHHLSATLAAILESIVFMLGPDCDLEELFEEAQRLREDGISPDLLADALPICINTVLGGMIPDDELAWRETVVPALRSLEKVLQDSPRLWDSQLLMISDEFNWLH